jgi:putative copper export protein
MTIFLHTVLTWLELTAFILVFGLALFRLPAFARPTPLPLQNDQLFSPGIRRVFAAALGLIVLTSLGGLLLRAEDGEASLFRLLSESDYGALWLTRIGCLLLLFLLVQTKRGREAVHGRYLMFLLALVLGWTESATGHAAEYGHFTLREMLMALHLLAVASWGGGVVILSFVILPFFKRRADIIPIVALSRRFSRVAGYAAGFLLLTAAYNMKIYVGDFESLWKTTYGLTVMAKMLLLYVLLLTGALNRWLSLPLLEHVAGGRFEGSGPIMRLIDWVLAGVRGAASLYVTSIYRKLVSAEAVLILAALLCAALLAQQAPPRQMNAGVQERTVPADDRELLWQRQ